MGQKKAKNHHVSFGKSRLARAAFPFTLRSGRAVGACTCASVQCTPRGHSHRRRDRDGEQNHVRAAAGRVRCEAGRTASRW